MTVLGFSLLRRASKSVIWESSLPVPKVLYYKMTSGGVPSIRIPMKGVPMSREEKNRIEYITMCIFLFASHFGMRVLDALGYLLDFGGISFLEDGYDIEHTLPIEDTLEALQVICARNGGQVA